jgi:hypothetical protein
MNQLMFMATVIIFYSFYLEHTKCEKKLIDSKTV